MKLRNKLEGASTFRAWKSKIDLILTRNNVLDIMIGKVVELEGTTGKNNFKEDGIIAMSLAIDSIRHILIPYIAKPDTSWKMYDVLTNLFIVKNVG